MSTAPVSQTAHKFPFSGASPGISANGTNNAIAWVLERDASGNGKGPAVLWAFDAYNLSNKLYSSSDAGTRDQLPIAREFQVPVVANGHVYVATQTSLAVYGLFEHQRPRLSIDSTGLTLRGLSGNTYRIEYADGSSTNLEWQAVADIGLTNSVQSFPSPVPLTEGQGFFRAILTSGQP